MLKFIIIGADEIALSYMRLIQTKSDIEIIAIISNSPTFNTGSLAKEFQIRVAPTDEIVLYKHADYIIYPNKQGELLSKLSENSNVAELLQRNTLGVFNDMVAMPSFDKDYLPLVCNDLEDGLIIIDNQEVIRFINSAAAELLEKTKRDIIGETIKNVIPHTRLPAILETRTKELNHTFILEDGEEIMTSRFPLINKQNHLEGAYAFLQNKNTMIKTAKQYTDYSKFKEMLKTLMDTTQEAISFVDEFGILKMCNDKYLALKKYPNDNLIGRQATSDVFEGNSVHSRVLSGRRLINDLEMDIGPFVFVINATPIIIDGKLKGSLAVFNNITQLSNCENELNKAKQLIRKLETTYLFKDVIYQSKEMKMILEQAAFAAKTNVAILLKGAKGTGKAMLANAIHNEGDRKYNRFIHVKCAVDERDLVKQLALGNGGTIFIDDIELLPATVQQELLHIIKTKELDNQPFDVRVIAATKVDLEFAVNHAEFSQELLTEIKPITIALPPLNKRKVDLEHLIDYFIDMINQMHQMNLKGVSAAALKVLADYAWPGNISELEAVLKHAAILLEDQAEFIELDHLQNSFTVTNVENKPADQPLQKVMDEHEREYIKSAYKLEQYNKTKTAKVLGISVRNLYYKIDKYELDIN